MNRIKGFTLIELLIVIAIVVILVVVFGGLFTPRKAGAHEVVHAPEALRTALASTNTGYTWFGEDHRLTILDKGDADWPTAAEACSALKPHATGIDHLHVTMRSNDGAGELRWEDGSDARVLTNLPTSTTASC